MSTITIGPDGRLYLQEVTPDVLDLASLICPGNDSLQSRIACARESVEQIKTLELKAVHGSKQ